MTALCTLFDSSYLTRGLALLESVRRFCPRSRLFILAFDDLCEALLTEMHLEGTTVISLSEFEDAQLLAVKPGRSRAEYCWTCTPSLLLFLINRLGLESCTYVDADLYFWDSPEVLWEELAANSILITEHRYYPRYDRSREFGTYCVQFMTFRSDSRGLTALKWWRDRCLEWCYARHEDGKFGDQKYLDDWPSRFEGVHVLRNPGGGLAPWNIQYYELLDGGDLRLRGQTRGNGFRPIFFHFHHLRFYSAGWVDLGGYRLSLAVRRRFYSPYLSHLKEIARRVPWGGRTTRFHGETDLDLRNPRGLLRHVKHVLQGNVVSWEKLLAHGRDVSLAGRP